MIIALATARNILDTCFGPQYNTGTIQIRDGTQPADPETAATGTLLATITLPNPCFAAAVNGTGLAIASANAIAQTNGVAAGTATWGRAFETGGVTVIADMTVGTDITLSNPVIGIGSPIDVTLFTITMPTT